MAEVTPSQDFLTQPDGKPVVPGGLNVLTILTFIGSGLGFLGVCWNFFNAKKGIEAMENMINSPQFDSMPAFAKKFYTPEALELARKAYENRIPITLIGLIGIGLCVYGAIQMRKRKMQGYYMYVIGELIPFVVNTILLGVGFITGMSGLIGVAFAILFVLLYTMQRKHLTEK